MLRKGDRLRVQGVGTPFPDDTECAWLSRSTPFGFPKRTFCKEVVSQQDGRCCKDHPKLGHCVPGKDDDPNGGKCWTYCITKCSKGGLCKKLFGGRHVCHCYC
ncbi:hypothetical protein VitviT2T_028287 [Vitis vinifera]|uniref:Uncharacterized protein n=1 Tax=Vitis vinifera TaxID=29760 RepID=A0ABY9DSK1_VITVI|nr:hypothetical protein VitviT2T_028287 [Vitis vinifera]